MQPAVSVIIPAHNEERLLPRGLAAVKAAARELARPVEIIVVANRCTDATRRIALDAGAMVVESSARNIAAVRNAGAAVARGEVLVTIDADCSMSSNALVEVACAIESGRYVGGGVRFKPERMSPGIFATLVLLEVTLFVTRLGGGMFWCRREDFDAIGGFDESLLIAEDLEFARRLRAHGKRIGRRFTTLRTAPIITSTRKFDAYGDWHMFGLPLQARAIWATMRGTDTAWADRYFFDFNG